MWNKITLHIFAALFSGFTFWKIGNGSFDLQLRVFAIFNFIFVAPGCINQMQPFFLHNRDLFETREKKVSRLSSSARKSECVADQETVQNLPLAGLHRRPDRLRDPLPHPLRDPLLRLLVLHRRLPCRRKDLGPHLPADDLYVHHPFP